ncbi:intraflagellar transport particle [Raphidocelis subcapitata]|uniref:Intraflagellar transport particle n=1 Tax=Raphidocelis subcapitata TaxID=307507 RepID=A0A2V0NZ60_9CHLO|nr:intraflagellar transport particle [Raphidocelis subcapitata]|eukprot:GBF92609.1 intraflagellar transport particle [Raphidocelis subcapitata]
MRPQENCTAFVASVQELKETVGSYVGAVEAQVARIEAEKLRAVGLRNRVAALHEERRRKRQELLQLLQEKQEELDRLLAEEESLQRVRREQELAVGKLADGAGGGLPAGSGAAGGGGGGGRGGGPWA